MNLGMSDLGPGSEFLKDFLLHYHGASARTGTPPFWLSCWKVPLVWGPHVVWNLSASLFCGGNHQCQHRPMLDQITHIPEISQEAAPLPATFLIPSICSSDHLHLGLLFRCSHVSALSHT